MKRFPLSSGLKTFAHNKTFTNSITYFFSFWYKNFYTCKSAVSLPFEYLFKIPAKIFLFFL